MNVLRGIIDHIRHRWRTRDCPHLRRRMVFGDERRYASFRCEDCGRPGG